jgi:hypothetical protein
MEIISPAVTYANIFYSHRRNFYRNSLNYTQHQSGHIERAWGFLSLNRDASNASGKMPMKKVLINSPGMWSKATECRLSDDSLMAGALEDRRDSTTQTKRTHATMNTLWNYAENTFEVVTRGSFKLMSILITDHKARCTC